MVVVLLYILLSCVLFADFYQQRLKQQLPWFHTAYVFYFVLIWFGDLKLHILYIWTYFVKLCACDQVK